MTWLFLLTVVVGIALLDWKVSKGLRLLREGVELLRQLRDSVSRSEQDSLDLRADALKRGAGGSPPVPR
jgi:hypothetical protein